MKGVWFKEHSSRKKQQKNGKTNSPSHSLRKQVDTVKNILSPGFVHLHWLSITPTHLTYDHASNSQKILSTHTFQIEVT